MIYIAWSVGISSIAAFILFGVITDCCCTFSKARIITLIAVMLTLLCFAVWGAYLIRGVHMYYRDLANALDNVAEAQ